MKQPKTWIKATLAVAGSLMVAGVAQAQFATNVISDFHNFNLSVTYANWNVAGSDILNGGSGFTPVITSGPTSYRVQAQGYGSGAFNLSTPASAPGATQFLFTFTINSPSGTYWMNPGLSFSDGTHQVFVTAANAEGGFRNYGNYTGGNTYTLYGALGDLDTTTVTAFNLEFDPAGFGGGAPYDITFHSLSLLTPVPEPSSMALLGLGAMGLWAARRRSLVG